MLANPLNQTRGPANAPATFTFATLPTATSVAPRQAYFVSDIGPNGSWWFSNGTKWAPINGSVVIAQNGMPWINLSSGSIAAGGGLSGITALVRAYAKAWVYLPANAVATVSAAGWRYCTFSTTTAGTVFLDQPSGSFPVVWPSSPTAVTDGKGAYTSAGNGSTSILLPNISIPANVMGINGQFVVQGQVDHRGSDASNIQVQFDSSVFPVNAAIPNSNNSVFGAIIANAGATGVQNAGANTYNNATSGAVGQGSTALDTTASHNMILQTQVLAAAVDNVVISSFVVTLYNDGQ